MEKKKRQRKTVSRTWLGFAIACVIVLLSLISMCFIGYILLENAAHIGWETADSYSREEENQIAGYEKLLDVCAEYVEEMIREGAGDQEIISWLDDYFHKVTGVVGEDSIDPYAVVDHVAFETSMQGNQGCYKLEEACWYQMALANKGRVIFTDAYTDALTGKTVVTIARECGDGSSVIAFDIYPESFQLEERFVGIPEGSAYYLCDGKGRLLWGNRWDGEDIQQDQIYIDSIFPLLSEEEDESLLSLKEGERCILYYHQTENGWYSIFTMPVHSVLRNLLVVAGIYLAVFLLLVTAACYIWKRDQALNHDMTRLDETVHVLSNLYYAIYRIDYVKGTYDMLKKSPNVAEQIGKQGKYQELLAVLGEIISKEAYQEFQDSFSLANIQSLVEKRVRNFGGDFLRAFDGVYRWVNVQLLVDDRLENEVILCFREVDKEKQIRLQQVKLLENALERAQKSEESQKQFFSNMSHDMRTPLNVIIGMSEMAANYDKEPDKLLDYMQKIHVSGKQLLGLINDILEMSRLENGIRFESKQFNLREALEESCRSFQIKAQSEGKSFALSIEVTKELVLGDMLRFSQIINNLLSNAVKYTPAGGSISVDLKQVSDEEVAKYQVTVKDTGIGMSDEFLQKLFLPYEREKRFDVETVAGTGLGMSIVKNLVHQMNGEIRVESRLKKGTVFTILLPFETKGAALGIKKEEKALPKPEYSLEGKHVLLVEDFEMNMEIATDILEMWGAKVTQARNGKEAVEAFEASEEFFYDLILMDMQMPVMNGCEAACAIRRKERKDAEKILIIALTANAFAEDIARTVEAGMNAHISKPIDMTVLLQTLGRLLAEDPKRTA